MSHTSRVRRVGPSLGLYAGWHMMGGILLGAGQFYGSWLEGQTPSAQTSTNQTSASVDGSSSEPEPLVVAGFTASTTPFIDTSAHLLRACEGMIDQAVRVNVRAQSAAIPAVVPTADSIHALPTSATAAGRRCLGTTSPQPAQAYDWPLFLRLAVAINDARLVDRLVTRQLERAGSDTHDRIAVLEAVITLLLHNTWGSPVSHDYRTPAHETLAYQYAAQIDTMQPAAMALPARLRVAEEFAKLYYDTLDIERKMAALRRTQQLAQSVPLGAVSAADRPFVAGVLSRTAYALAQLTYLHTPNHANLTRLATLQDSIMNVLRHRPLGQPVDVLLGHPAGQIEGTYWFNLPAGSAVPNIPAPGVVSLLVFLDPREGNITSADTKHELEQLRQLHHTYPALQIVVIAMTSGQFQSQELRERPEQEAELIHHYFSDELQLPGILCVIRTQYHTEAGATAVPRNSPVLDRYHLDPRAYNGHEFLIDAEGWIVQDQNVLEGQYIQALVK